MDDFQKLVNEFSLLMPDVMRGFSSLLFDPRLLEDLTSPQFILLAFLTEQIECNASMVGEAMHITSGSVTSLTERLVQRGLIERKNRPDDRRVVMFSLTKAGQDKFEEVRQKQLERLFWLFDKMGLEKTQQLIVLYRELNHYLADR